MVQVVPTVCFRERGILKKKIDTEIFLTGWSKFSETGLHIVKRDSTSN